MGPMSRCVSLVLLALATWAPAQGDREWVWFSSMETAKGPVLELTLKGGGKRRVAPTRDSVLIEYLAQRAWGQHKSLSISRGDTNRVIMHFDTGRGGDLARATLVLDLNMGTIPPQDPITAGVHEVTSEWGPHVRWSDQPTFEPRPVMSVALPTEPDTVRLDVTTLVKKWMSKPAENRGLLIRSPRSLHKGTLKNELADAFAWEIDAEKALKVAQREKKAVLALVLADKPADKPSFVESTLIATVLIDPDVSALIREHFVPLRLTYQAMHHMYKWGGRKDPLRPLGTSVHVTKAPALVVASASGKHRGSLQSLGTYDRDLILRFLQQSHGSPKAAWKKISRGAQGPLERCEYDAWRGEHTQVIKKAPGLLKKDTSSSSEILTVLGTSLMRLGKPSEAERALRDALRDDVSRSPRAAYYLGCLLDRTQRTEEARKLWESLAASETATPWSVKATARLVWPSRMADFESLGLFSTKTVPGGTETVVKQKKRLRELALHAAEQLLARQRRDGTWRHTSADQYHAAITSLAGRALLAWRPRLTPALQERVTAALDRADRWLLRYLSRQDPNLADSFGAAYMLEYLVARSAESQDVKAQVPDAIRFLIGGQCSGGAWSYSRRFGENWKGGFGGWPVTDKGRFHSMNTGLSLWALSEARQAGYRVPKKALDEGVSALKAMATGDSAYTYTWPEPICFEKKDQSISKAPLCKHALFSLDSATRKELESAVDEFMKNRRNLRTVVKLTTAHSGPHGSSSYFYFFAYYHGARAVVRAGGPKVQRRLKALRDDLLGVVEADGTWVDYEELGKSYGTAMALLVMDMAHDN